LKIDANCVETKEGLEIAEKVMLFGLTPARLNISVNPYNIFRREQTINASFINPYTQERAVKLLASRRIDVKSIIADDLPLDNINRVFEDSSIRAKGKVIINP
jgi:L-iditol 2-dehydrogenase